MLHHMGLVEHFYLVVPPAYVCLGLYSLIVGEPSYCGQHAQSHEDVAFGHTLLKSVIGAETFVYLLKRTIQVASKLHVLSSVRHSQALCYNQPYGCTV